MFEGTVKAMNKSIRTPPIPAPINNRGEIRGPLVVRASVNVRLSPVAAQVGRPSETFRSLQIPAAPRVTVHVQTSLANTAAIRQFSSNALQPRAYTVSRVEGGNQAARASCGQSKTIQAAAAHHPGHSQRVQSKQVIQPMLGRLVSRVPLVTPGAAMPIAARHSSSMASSSAGQQREAITRTLTAMLATKSNAPDIEHLKRIIDRRNNEDNYQTTSYGVPIEQFAAPPQIASVGGHLGAMGVPVGGRVDGPNKVDTHTLYANGSNFMRLNPQGHGPNGTPHAHAHAMGTGPGKNGQGFSVDVYGHERDFKSAEAHWELPAPTRPQTAPVPGGQVLGDGGGIAAVPKK